VAKNDFDLIVIGAGGAGLSAAVTAADAGCSVLVVESEEKVGGSTALSQGVFTAAGTSVQRALGFEDSADAFYEHYMTLNHCKLPASVVRAFCDNAAPTLEWLISLGVEYPLQLTHKPKGAVWPCAADAPGLYSSGLEHPPRGHMPVGNGYAYIAVLDERRGALGAELALKSRVTRLVNEDGRVVGIESGGDMIRAGAVAVTCGGFGHDHALLRRWFPIVFDGVPESGAPTTISAPGSRGDAIRMAEQVGAWITGVNCGLVNTRPRITRTPEMPRAVGTQPTSIIYVNREGHRFVDETAPYAVMPAILAAQGNVAWGIFDEQTRLASDVSQTHSGTTQGSGSWSPEFVLDRVRAGDFKRADTIAELCRICGIKDAAAVDHAIAAYNADLPGGRDRRFLRDLDGLRPIASAPFYAFEYRATDVNLTGAGMTIDAQGHVLDPNGDVIPGLFAAGEAGAGVLGERYVGGGNSVANALTMGRIVGRTVARERAA